ncbi:MAG: hypothetical protein WBV82_17930 [Myxococcaceae bacterium]
MDHSDALDAFNEFLRARHKSLEALTPAEGLSTMLSFYRKVRAADCKEASDEDMLLFQWGTHDWGDGPRFELDITRQFMPGEDEGVWQLSLTFVFEPDAELEELGSGDEWCHNREELEDFAEALNESEALAAVGERKPADVELDFNDAE